jgi:hypothetical protein
MSGCGDLGVSVAALILKRVKVHDSFVKFFLIFNSLKEH